jgi:hypothetical protein
MTEAEERAMVIAEARGWLGTPPAITGAVG